MTTIEKLRNHEQKLNMEVIAIAPDKYDDNNVYVMAYNEMKNEFIVWNFNKSNDCLYNGSYHFDVKYALESYEKRIK